MLTLALAGLLTGCTRVKIYDDTGDTTPADDTGDTDTTGSDSGDTNGGDDSGDTDTNTDNPEVVSGTVQCQSSDGDDPFNTYYIDSSVSDPQGSGDIATVGSKVYAYDEDGSLIFSDDILVCTNNACVGSFREDTYDALDCDSITSQRFTIEVFDESGNSSGEFKLTALIDEA